MLSTKMELGLTFVIIVVNALFFIYWGLKMLVEVKYTIIGKVPKLYVCLFLCNDFERFKVQQKKQQEREQNEFLREGYERSTYLLVYCF